MIVEIVYILVFSGNVGKLTKFSSYMSPVPLPSSYHSLRSESVDREITPNMRWQAVKGDLYPLGYHPAVWKLDP